METRLVRLLDERDAIRLIVDFYACLDRGDGPGCAGCFVPDGVWERDRGPVSGHEAIAQAVAERLPSRRTVHTALNFRFESEGGNRATLHCVLVAYEAAVEDPAAVPPGRMAGIRHCTDALEKWDGAWRIRRRASAPLMRGHGG